MTALHDPAWLPWLLGVLIGALIGRATAGAAAALRRMRGVAAPGPLPPHQQPAHQQAGHQPIADPVHDTMLRVEQRLRELELARVSADGAITEQVNLARAATEQLSARTGELVSALRAPQTRGRWGELQLHRVVELAGMVEHCDFSEQVALRTDAGHQRPDLVVHLTGGRSVVVDAKVPLGAYLDAATTDAACPEDRLRAHARALRAHVDTLAGRRYWRGLPDTPEFVVLFLPGESFLAPALERDPDLLEHAMSRSVVLATPTTLVAMLRTVAWSWQQDALATNAREVFDLGRELYARLSTMGEHVDRLGRSLTRAVEDYNATLGSLESRVLVSARRMRDLRVVTEQIPVPRPAEAAARPPAATEFVSG